MNEKRKVGNRKRGRTKIPCPKPRLITLNLSAAQQAINKVVGTLCNPDYQEQMAKLTQDSVNNSMGTIQGLTQLSCRLSRLDNKGWDSLINCSIDDLMRAYLQFNSDLIVLLQKQSSNTIKILEKNLPSEEGTESEPLSE